MRRTVCLIGLGLVLFGTAANAQPAPPPDAASRDMYCRQSAAASTGYVTPGQAARNAQATGTIGGLLGGAALGAILGGRRAGEGAAIGAGVGAVAGTAVGANNANAAAAEVRQRYSETYYNCMYSGNGAPPTGYYAPEPPPPSSYPPTEAQYPYPPPSGGYPPPPDAYAPPPPPGSYPPPPAQYSYPPSAYPEADVPIAPPGAVWVGPPGECLYAAGSVYWCAPGVVFTGFPAGWDYARYPVVSVAPGIVLDAIWFGEWRRDHPSFVFRGRIATEAERRDFDAHREEIGKRGRNSQGERRPEERRQER